ncbi:hypothetical protein pb186bvf_008468 [Paramecium bursaria]
MEEYYEQFKHIQKRIQLRDKASAEVIEQMEPCDARKALLSDYGYYNFFYYCTRLAPVLIVGGLYQFKTIQRKSRYFHREILIALSLMGGMFYADYQASEWFWQKNGHFIMENSSFNDNGIKKVQMDKMRDLYLKSKNQKAVVVEKQKILDSQKNSLGFKCLWSVYQINKYKIKILCLKSSYFQQDSKKPFQTKG